MSTIYIYKHIPCLIRVCAKALLFVWFCSTTIYAQQTPSFSNKRSKTIQIDYPAQQVDSLTIAPHSVFIVNSKTKEAMDSTLFVLKNNVLHWDVLLQNDTLEWTVQYRVLPYQFAAKQQHIDTLKIAESLDASKYIQFDYSPYKNENRSLFSGQNIDYSGSFARGVAFGNRQDLVLNSSFNLQMEGTVGNGITIRAALSDANVPLQPDGNTQQLQDFDKLYIQIEKDEHQLTAGDYEISSTENNYFLKYYKKLQGATYQNTSTLFSKGKLTSQASIAIARGNFARQTIPAQEGNQGPYRLRGNEGERFIIILGATEKVYLDGILLQRGLEKDYVIDYNRGDITFTSQRLITKDSRIIVEFEYSVQRYLRSLYALGTQYQDDKWQLSFQLLSQQDSRNTSGLTELSAAEKQTLTQSGDQSDNNFSTGIRPLQDNNSLLTYQLMDSLVNGVLYDSVLVYMPQQDSSAYTARFTEVGAGNGSYIRVNDATNGAVFQWVAPDVEGVLQGDYAPIVRLVPPVLHQVYSFGARYQLSSKSYLRTEIALSNQDRNRFSALDTQDDVGTAVFAQYHFDSPFGQKDSTWTIATDVNYEYKQAYFRELNPYRSTEFVRDWNAVNQTPSDEHLVAAGLRLRKADLGYLSYQLNSFLRGTNYTGIRHLGDLFLQKAGFELSLVGNFLTTKSMEQNSQFFRPKLDLSKTFSSFNNIKIGIYAEREQNTIRSNMDTLIATSFYYDLYKFYIKNTENEALQWSIDYGQRYDYAPTDDRFKRSTIADNVQLQGNWKGGKRGNLGWNFSYRQLQIVDEQLTQEQALETYLGKLDYTTAFYKGAIRLGTAYQLGAGQEPKLEYNYIEVNTGEGLYQWNDYNQDSLQQINEFEIAINQDQARFVRVAILTNDFIRTHKVQLNQTLSLTPAAIWRQEKGAKVFLSKWATQSNFSINRRTRLASGVQFWNPFQQNLSDTTLVATTLTNRHSLFFNRSHPVYSLQLSWAASQNRIVLTTGFEDQQTNEYALQARWRIFKQWESTLKLAQGGRSTDSELFDTRDYAMVYEKIEPALTYSASQRFSMKANYLWQNSRNELVPNGENALIQKVELRTTYNQSTKTAIRLEVSYAKVRYEGEINTPVAFALLENLRPGENFLWNIGFDRQLGRNMQLNLSYEGRKTGAVPVVHIGRAQVRALF